MLTLGWCLGAVNAAVLHVGHAVGVFEDAVVVRDDDDAAVGLGGDILRISITFAPFSLSSAAVGSSQMISFGSCTSARAMATRCCCPPESMFGR